MEEGNHKGGSSQHWKVLWAEICSRVVEPTAHPSFIMFFLLTVIVISPAGIWLELYRFLIITPTPTSDALLTSIATFSPALMTSSCLQVIWGKPLPSFRAFLISVSIISGIGWIFCVAAPIQKSTSIALGLVLSFIALCVWWMSNATQKELRDDFDFSAPVGGDNLNGELSGKGGLDEFKY